LEPSNFALIEFEEIPSVFVLTEAYPSIGIQSEEKKFIYLRFGSVRDKIFFLGTPDPFNYLMMFDISSKKIKKTNKPSSIFSIWDLFTDSEELYLIGADAFDDPKQGLYILTVDRTFNRETYDFKSYELLSTFEKLGFDKEKLNGGFVILHKKYIIIFVTTQIGNFFEGPFKTTIYNFTSYLTKKDKNFSKYTIELDKLCDTGASDGHYIFLICRKAIGKNKI